MSSIRTRAAQRVLSTQIKESFNRSLITRDANLDSLFDECRQVEGYMKNAISFADHLKRSIEGIGVFCSGMNMSLGEIYATSHCHQRPSEQICGVHFSLAEWAGEAVRTHLG